jgi:DedD protein
MARATSDEEIQLKRRARRRLIGAVVLVMAIIVVLPMVLDSEPKPSGQEVKVQIPSPDSGTFTSKVVPLPAAPEKTAPKPASAPAAEGAKSVDAAPPPAEKPAVVKETPKEAPKETPKQEAAKPEVPKPTLKAETELPKAVPAKPAAKAVEKKKPKPTAKESAKPADGKFVVQVIALADAARAKQMQVQIAAGGIKSYTEVVKTAKGDVTRVRAGPFATRQQAEKARAQLKALGMSGNIATK